MSNVTIQIGGRAYTVACDTGQERHVATLGRAIDEKLASLGPNGGQNETRSLLFAALLLADEAHELKKAQALPEPAPSSPPPATDEASLLALEAVAARLENLATSLEA